MPGAYREDYLSVLYELAEEEPVKTRDIAKRLNVKDASVTEMLKKLADEGYITYQPYHGATLTKKGGKVAVKIKRKHRLLERFLYDMLGIKKERVHEQACMMEHALSDEAADALDGILGHPKKCPDDGKSIPQNARTRQERP